MNAQSVPLDRQSWERFVRHVKVLAGSETGGKALGLFALLILFLFAINGLNVLNSYVGRDFMTAIADRNRSGFQAYALRWIGVFAAITVVSVVSRYTEERLGLIWRVFLARRTIHFYSGNRVYFHLAASDTIGNPDQRIADDIKAFTTSTLSFVLMLVNSAFTVVAFSGVLWSISPLLLGVAVLYAALGSALTIWLGKPLVRLNFDQLDKEADFRSALIYLREHAEAVALTRRETPITRKLLQRLDELAENLRRLIQVNRNVGFFTTFYNWLIQIIPALLVAPLFISGEAEFGVITQSAMAFTALLGAFSLIVTQFQSLSSFAAVLARLSSFSEAIEQQTVKRESSFTICEDGEQLAYSGLSLRSPRSGRILLNQFSATIPRGHRVLVAGEDETARAALFRASAGLWEAGEGKISRPGLDRVLFVTEKPYLVPGTLRQLFQPPQGDWVVPAGTTVLADFSPAGPEPAEAADEPIHAALATLGLESLASRFQGLDAEQDWGAILPLGEQQLLVFARLLLVRPAFVFLDRPTTALGEAQLDRVLECLAGQAIGYVLFAETEEQLQRYDALLRLEAEGQWQWRTLGKN